MAPMLNVTMNKGKIPVPQFVSSATLRKISGHPLAIGYTDAKLKISFSRINTPERSGPNGKEIFFAGGTMVIMLVQEVFISIDLSECERRKWTDHENHHVRDNMDCLDDLENEFLTYPTSDEFFQQGVSYPAADGKAKGAEIITEIELAFQSLNGHKVNSLDTQAEYRRVARDILANCPGPIIYTVQSGDTLSQIAIHYYGSASSRSKILAANFAKLKGNGNLLPIGTKLRIPQ